MFGGSVYVIYNRDLISLFSLTIIHSNKFYLWLKHDHKRAHKNSIKPIINGYYSFNNIIIIFLFPFLRNNYIIITYLLLCGLQKSCPLQHLALIICLLHKSPNLLNSDYMHVQKKSIWVTSSVRFSLRFQKSTKPTTNPYNIKPKNEQEI